MSYNELNGITRKALSHQVNGVEKGYTLNYEYNNPKHPNGLSSISSFAPFGGQGDDRCYTYDGNEAGRRTYFFDVRETKAGDYYLTITESKKNFGENGEATFEKHKIYLYKEDFKAFQEMFHESTDFIIQEKGEDVISERHDKDFKSRSFTIDTDEEV